jgi:hypothetical protein
MDVIEVKRLRALEEKNARLKRWLLNRSWTFRS